MNGRITELVGDLERKGIRVNLRGLQEELDVIERPPSLLGRLTQGARKAAAGQWRNILGELGESREMMGLLHKRLRQDRPLTGEERDKIRAQMFDLLRIVPAGFIAAANTALPIPGTGIFTPWILARLGLMPSHWREAHLLDQLHREAARLRAQGHAAAADQLTALEQQIEAEADARDAAAHQAALLTHWDANNNGVWDDAERDEYQLAVEKMTDQWHRFGTQKRWFLQAEEQVFGPVRLSEIFAANPEGLLLVCFDGRSGWICLGDLQKNLRAQIDPSAGG